MTRRRGFRPRRSQQRGFTLVELMVALVLFSLVTAGMLSVAMTMATGFRDQEVTISTESATRSTLDYIADALRNSSPGVSSGKIINLDSAACESDTLKVQYNQATPFGNTADKLTVVFASGSVVTHMTAGSYNGGGATLTVANGSQFANGDYAVLTNFTEGHLVKITGATATSITVASPNCGTPALPSPSGYIAGSTTIIRAMKATFSVGSAPSDDVVGTVPVLNMDADSESALYADEPIAEGIESLEVVIGADSNADGVISAENATAGDADEWIGNNAGDTKPVILTSVRAVRVSIVARTTRQFSGNARFRLNALEDRAANAALDNFRRRTLSTTIEIRNLVGSP